MLYPDHCRPWLRHPQFKIAHFPRLDTAEQSGWEHSAELQIAFLVGIPYACSVCAFDVRFPPCLPFASFAQTCERLPYWRVQL